MSASWIARAVGVNRGTVYAWLKGTEPYIVRAVAIALLWETSEYETSHTVRLVQARWGTAITEARPKERRGETRGERLLKARRMAIERQLPADGRASPLWQEYIQILAAEAAMNLEHNRNDER
jgi:AcrR family transcriptional regulator